MSISEDIKVLEAYERGQPVERMPHGNREEWIQIARRDHRFDFDHYLYRVVVFPTATYAIYSPVTKGLGSNAYGSPADASAAAAQRNLKAPSEHWTPIRLVECGQKIERDLPRIEPAEPSKVRQLTEPRSS